MTDEGVSTHSVSDIPGQPTVPEMEDAEPLFQVTVPASALQVCVVSLNGEGGSS